MELATKTDIEKLFQVMKKDIIREITAIIPKAEPDHWMTAKEVMEYLSWSRSTFAKYRPKMPFRKIGQLYIKKSELDQWIEQKIN